MSDSVEQKAAETLLERGVRVMFPAPRFIRMFGKKEIGFTMHQPTMGTLLEVSRLSLESNFNLTEVEAGDMDAAHRIVTEHSRTVARIAAVVFLNNKTGIRFLSGLLSRYIFWHCDARKLSSLIMLVVTISGIEDFIDTIRLIRNMKMTSPKNLSPQGQGSQQVDQSA